LRTRGASATDSAKSARNADWHAKRDALGTICGSGMRDAASAGRKRPLCDRAIRHGLGACYVQWAAISSIRQPGDLRADGNTVDHRGDTDEGNRNVEVDMNIAFPYQFDGRGRTAETDQNDHIRDLIEQVLFTAPGERVNRPDFGCGLLQLVFEPNGPELATATQLLVQGALQQTLGNLIQISNVTVTAVDSQLTVLVEYFIRATQQQVVATFTSGGSST
jgi:uncharacterized protein